ncbi:MAG: dethiobiotin synthase [Isosphaeraceae bacterium]|nr:dethiobiotin synthase [Isosphaeraceae bacterium]
MSMPGLFVVGTDTGVGKTFVAAAIARALVSQGLRVGVLKPVATGATRHGDELISDDAELLAAALGQQVPRRRVVPLVFEEALAPCVAARRAGSPLTQLQIEQATSEALAWWESCADVVVVEGIGGFLCPLAEETTVADLAVTLDYPLVIVARRGLGTLNHTLLTVEAARRRGLRIAGIVLNAAELTTNPRAEATNAEELARRLGGVAILAELPHQPDTALLSNLIVPLNWYSRSGLPRLVKRD